MYDEYKAMQLDNDLRWRRKALQENESEFGDWRMAKAFENLLSSLSNTESDTDFLAKLHNWVNEQAEYLADHIKERETVRAEINDLEVQIASNVD